MESATSEIEPPGQDAAVDRPHVEPNDPERDINAKATVTWVLAWTAVLAVGLWLMLHLFDAILFRERQTKVETLPPAELQSLLERERAILGGQWEEGAPRKSIDEVMREMAK